MISYARKLGAFVTGCGLAVAIGAIAFNPPLLVMLILLGNAAVCVWWGLKVFIWRKPW